MNPRRRCAPFAFGVLSCALLLSGGGMWSPVSAAKPDRMSNACSASLHLRNDCTLTVGSDTTYPPMEFLNTTSHKYVGADIDLANAIAHAMGLHGAAIVSHTFTTIIPAMLVRHQFDVIMSSMSDTPARRKIGLSFVDYMQGNEAILVRKNSGIFGNSYHILCGHSVAVESGTTEQDGLNAAKTKCGSGKSIDIHAFAADTDAYNAFAASHVDAYTGDYPVVVNYVKLSHGKFRAAGKSFSSGGNYGIAIPKTNFALKQAIRKALHKIEASGQYMQILRKWGVAGARLK